VAGILVAAVGITACGGSAPPDLRAGADDAPQTTDGEPVLVAALGDSITAGSPLWDPDPAVRAQLPAIDRKSQYEHWAERRLRGKASFRNCGVFGERTDEIRERLDDCAAGAGALIVQGGINDIAQGRPVEAAAADLEAIVERSTELGLDTAIVEVRPWNNGFPAAAGEIRRLNELIAAIGERQDVPVLGFYEALEDRRAPGLMAKRLTIDGDHPSIAGYRRLGELIAVPPGAR